MSWFLERRAFFAVHETFCWVDLEEMICESLTFFSSRMDFKACGRKPDACTTILVVFLLAS
jgi:hypothetical protein